MFRKFSMWFNTCLWNVSETLGIPLKNPHIVFGKMIGIKGIKQEDK